MELPTTYFGGKGQGGTVRRLINVIPPHDYYVEPFFGRGRLYEAKAPARIMSFGYELDGRLVDGWKHRCRMDLIVERRDGLEALRELLAGWDVEGVDPSRVVVYFDPPYLLHTRRAQRATYYREWCDEDHIAFLAMLPALKVRAIVSHLPCVEYGTALAGWHSFTFNNKTHKGLQLEQVWCNFVPGPELHEYTYVGNTFREREHFKRQFGIVRKRFDALPPPARIALLAMLATDSDCR